MPVRNIQTLANPHLHISFPLFWLHRNMASVSLPTSSLFQDQAIRPPDQAFSDCLIPAIPPLPPVPPHHYRASTTAASVAFSTPFVSPFGQPAKTTNTKTTKKRSRDHEPEDVCDLTIDDSDDEKVQPRQAPSSFGSDQSSGSASSDSHATQDSLGSLTTALKSQRLHAPHPSPADLRELRVAFFTNLLA